MENSNKNNNKKVALLILDGLGYGNDDRSNAVNAAKTPYLDYLLKSYPNSRLAASGEAVGLPKGQMGNSEVGHMNLGAGRVVYQELGRINKSMKPISIVTPASFTGTTLITADYPAGSIIYL